MKTRLFYILLLFCIICLYAYNNEYILFILLIVMLALLLPLYILTLITAKMINVSLEMKTKIACKGEDASYIITIENESIFQINKAIIFVELQNSFSSEIIKRKIVVPIKANSATLMQFFTNIFSSKVGVRINPNNITTLQGTIKSEHCGYVRMTIKKIKLYDMLGVTSFSKRKKSSDIYSVTPKIDTLPSEILVEQKNICDSDEFSKTKRGDDKSQVFDYHEYVQGDHMKNINWKLSSRLNKIFVKDFSLSLQSKALLMVEQCYTDEKTKKLNLDITDGLYQILLSISTSLNDNEIAHKIKWYDTSSDFLDEISLSANSSHEENIFITLSRLYHTKPYVGAQLFSTFSATNQEDFSRIFYITPILNKTMIDDILSVNENFKLTIILLKSEENPFDIHLFTELSAVEIIEIDLNNISAELAQNL